MREEGKGEAVMERRREEKERKGGMGWMRHRGDREGKGGNRRAIK